jgi:uncharacterized protein
MSLADKITEDLTTAMKSNNAARTAVLRLIKNSLNNEKIKLGHELSDDEVMKVLQREVKQRRDSIDAYQKAARGDLVEAEDEERRIIAEYLPAAMTEEDIAKIVDQVIAETNAQGMQQMGIVIGKVMSLVSGRAEGAEVSRLVKEKLGG